MKNPVFLDLRRVAPAQIDVSVEHISNIRVTKIGELGTTLAVTKHAAKIYYSYHPDDGSDTFLRNVGSCRNHMT
jgi:hypothetical protein